MNVDSLAAKIPNASNLKRKLAMLVLSVVRVRAIFCIMVLFLFCCHSPGRDDCALLEKLNSDYSGRYLIEIVDSLYLSVRAEKGYHLDEVDLINIYKSMVFRDFAKKERRDTPIVYLNAYNAKGHFVVQFYFDRDMKVFVKSSADYY